MRAAMHLFGERSLTLVAALFDNGTAAARAAGSLQRQQRGERCPVLVVEPNDPRLGRKMTPEPTGLWHTLLRSHARLAVMGVAAGAVIGAVLVAGDWDVADAAPGLTIVTAMAYGLLVGLLLAGLRAWGPDRGRVIHCVRDATARGRWAVVAHPRSAEEAEAARQALAREGGDIVSGDG